MNIPESLNIKKHCRQYRVGLWECPQFLFVLMGVVICASIILVYILGQRFYEEPEVTALVTLVVAAILFVIGHIIVSSFERIAETSRAKSEFISIMSHELRSPLSAIKWQLDVLLTDKSIPLALSSGSMQYLETINDQNERMIGAVNDLLEVNRIEDHDLVLRPASFSLEDLTRRIILEIEKYAASNNVKITIDVQMENTEVFADEERIKRAIGHLADNAIRYSTEGGDTNIVIKPQNQLIYWEITNRGVGIMPEDRSRIFNKFFRSPNIMRFQTEGTGIGLFIAKSIITMSGGSVGFKSSPEEGTVFWLTLPRSNKKP